MSTLRLAHRKDQQKVWARQRSRAGRLFERGWRQADIARRIGVDPRRVSDWYKRWKAGGLAALRSKGPVGGKSKLNQRQWRELERVLKAGPAAAGFDSGGWTLARIAAVVAERFGVVYHRYGLLYLLHQRGWSVQRPVVAATERDQAAIEAWRRRAWPQVRKRGTTTWAWIVFADESGVSTRPPLRTTWAPRGHTPRLFTPGRRRWLSLAGFICYHPARNSVLVHYTRRRKAFDTGGLIDALRGLRRFLMAPAVLVWDNLGAHHSAGMRCFLATQSRWLRVYALPSYAYDLNPADGMWGNLKTVDLANRVNTISTTSNVRWHVG